MEFDDFDEIEQETETDRILKKRNKIKQQLENKLRGLKFTESEMDEVFDIIDMAEAKIEQVKVSLNGTNINTKDPTPVMKLAFGQIRMLEQKMAIDIRQRISEILAKKTKR